MITEYLTRFGIPPQVAKAIVALFLIMVGGELTALLGTWPGTPPLVGFVLALAYLADPNAEHSTGGSAPVG